MKARLTLWFVLPFALALSVAAPALAQAPAAPKPFEPQVGAPGKDVIWVPTPQILVEKMLDMAKLTPQDYLMDLGSGDGRLVLTAARRGSRATGIEYNPDFVELSKKNAIAAGLTDKATFVKADLFDTDFSKAQVITMFLLPEINMQLRPKLLDLKPGTRIVSNTFSMEDWDADDIETVDENCAGNWCTALLWIVPAKVAGTWAMTVPGGGELMLTQQFQIVSGTLGTASANGRLRGDEMTFVSGSTTYIGKVDGNVIRGTLPRPWTATKQIR